MAPAAFANYSSKARRRRGAIAVIALAIAGCGYGDWPDRYDEFFELPPRERRTAILRYVPKDQLELHVHATCDLHPPYEHLAEVIVAQRGAAVIESLRHAAADRERGELPGQARCRADALAMVVEQLDRQGVTIDATTRALLGKER